MQRHLVFIDKITWWFFQKEREKKSWSKELQPTQVISIYYLPKMSPAVDLIHFLYNVYRVGVIKIITVTEWLQSCIQG